MLRRARAPGRSSHLLSPLLSGRRSRKEQLLAAPVAPPSLPLLSFVCRFQGGLCVRPFPRWARRTGRTRAHSRPLPSAIMAAIQSWQGSASARLALKGERKEKSPRWPPPSLLMELRAKGVFSTKRRDRQPLNVGSSSVSSSSSITTTSPSTQNGLLQPDRAAAAAAAARHTSALFTLA